ncbi:DUF3152 domain-containing protein [Blastococcus atacamensis]|uniref:DUF3152 domain-containing protein n=1 Tax=Blastococcus atacamensis TaxID=2070508 RepID=UPI000CEC7E94|nr:DUF3152 domain-containing protein [Blastococcus atacamensis]
MGGRLTDDRPTPRQGPLVAHREPRVPGRSRGPERGTSRVRRFVRRHGWRAHAIPFLVVATVVVLVDLAFHPPGPGTTTAAPAPERSASATTTAAPSLPSTPTAPAEGDAGPSGTVAPAVAGTYVERGSGTLSIVDGSSEVYGTGPLKRFVIEVEDGIGVDGPAFAAAVTQTLGDPRSWGSGGRMSFQRVGAAEAAARQYDFRVSLVSPGNMETYCPGVGTGGYTSCRYGERAVINLARWATAVPHYDGDVATYRLYVVNHEVGHALGNGHQDCPGPGQVAPVMQQQTLGLEGCAKNAWPFP